LNFVLKGMIA